MYRDYNGHDLREGFYRECSFEHLLYFTGRFGSGKNIIVNSEEGLDTYSERHALHWCMLSISKKVLNFRRSRRDL